MRFRVIAYVAQEGKMPDLMEAGYAATLETREAREGDLGVRQFQEAETPAGALLAAAVEDEGTLRSVAGYIADRALREEYEWRVLGVERLGGGLSPVEYAMLPAVLHLFGDEDKRMAVALLEQGDM